MRGKRTGTEPQRWFFVHIQKTAGTALWRRLKQQFNPAAVYPGPGDGEPPRSVLSIDHLRERWRSRRDELRVVTGHFPLCTTELLDAPFVTLTILRDPVERTLSQLRHYRETTAGDESTPLEEIYEDPVRFELLHNHMVKMLSLTPDEMKDGAMTRVEGTARRVERAKARLVEVDVVGFQEHFEDFCSQLTRRFGWNLGPAVFMNRTTPVEVSDGFRAQIAHDNAADLELYAFARELYERRYSTTT
jgi:hypothetical protein